MTIIKSRNMITDCVVECVVLPDKKGYLVRQTFQKVMKISTFLNRK